MGFKIASDSSEATKTPLSTIPVTNTDSTLVVVITKLNWDIQGNLKVTKQLNWLILGDYVTKTFDLNWDIHENITKTIALSWDIWESLSVTVSLAWDILETLSVVKYLKWDILAKVSGAIRQLFTVGRR